MDNPTQATETIAPDGRPLIELVGIEAGVSDEWALSGTACVFEGLVVIRVEHPEGTVTRYFSQASAGGPERGTWAANVVAGAGDKVVVGQTEMGEGPGARSIATREVVIRTRLLDEGG